MGRIMKPSRPNRNLFRTVAAYAKERKVLDVGCGNKTYSSVSGDVTTVDGWEKVSPDVLVNLENEDLPFGEGEFACVLLLDFIEHLTRERGLEILAQAKTITSGRIYLLTRM